MAVAVGSTSTLALGSRTNSTVTAPASISNGNLLLAFVAAGDAGDGTPPVVTGPAGWTKVTGSSFVLNNALDTGYATGINVFWKIAASESGSYTFTHSAADSQAIIYRITGHDATTPLNPTLTSSYYTSGQGKLATATGLTTANNDSLVLYVVALWDGGPGTPPAGSTPTFTERVDTGVFYIADGVMATAGATGDKVNATSFTSQGTASPWRALLVAVQADTGGGGRTATLAVTIDPVTVASSADLLIGGTFNVTVPAVTQTASADLLLQASLAQTIDPVTLAASGTLANVTNGTFAVTLDPVTLASNADLLIQGQLAQTIDPVTVSANADLIVSGSFGVTLEPVTLAANGNLVLASGTGNFGVTIEPVVLTADADLIVKGQLAVTIDPVTLAATGAAPPAAITGTFGVTIDPVTLSATGSESLVPVTPPGIPYWGPSGGPKQPEKKKKEKKRPKAPPPPRREGGHIPTKELRKAVRELLALEAAKEAERRKKPQALAKKIVEELPVLAIAGLAKKEAISFVAKELRQELPQSFYSEQVIRDNEKLMRIILLILKRLVALAALALQAAEDEEEEELIALLLSAA